MDPTSSLKILRKATIFISYILVAAELAINDCLANATGYGFKVKIFCYLANERKNIQRKNQSFS